MLNQQMTKENYFFSLVPSRWIGNFGVEPLLAVFFLRSLPITFALFCLRVFVTRVLETMRNLLLSIQINNFRFTTYAKFKLHCLPMILILVKAQILISFELKALEEKEPILLAIGEHFEIKTENMQNFTVGGNDILAYKFLKSKSVILIKGKKVGFTEVILWEKNQKKIKYPIYILSKAKHLQIMHLTEVLRPLNLSVSLHGPSLYVKGFIGQVEDLKFLLDLQKDYKKFLILNCDLTPQLKNEFLGFTIKTLIQNSLHHFRCFAQKLKIICEVPDQNNLNKELKEFLQQNYLVDFVSIQTPWQKNTFWADLKVIQVEKNDGEEFSLGPNQIFGSLGEIFQKGIKKIIDENQVLIEEGHLRISTLTESEISLKLKIPSTIEVGDEYPIAMTLNNRTKIIRQFAGLKMNLLLSEEGENFLVHYLVKISKEKDEHLYGGKEQSSLLINLSQPAILFDIGLWDNEEHREQIPFLGDIPLLGKLFQSNGRKNVYKKIFGIIKIKENPEGNKS